MGSYRVHLEVKCPQCGEVKTTRGVKGFRHCGRLHDVHQNLTQSGKQKYNNHRQYQKLYGDPDHERNHQRFDTDNDNNPEDNTDSQDSKDTGIDKLNPDNVFTNDSQRQRQQQQTRRGDNMSNEDNNDNEADDNDNEDNHKYHCNSCGVGFDRKLYRCRQCGKRFAWDKVE